MTFNLPDTISILNKTPLLLSNLLCNIDVFWYSNNEGPGTWSPFDVMGHLIHGEKRDWIPRAKIILSHNKSKTFETFDRTAQFENSKGKQMQDLLSEFEKLRRLNLNTLISWKLTRSDLNRTGIHPELGVVTMEQLLATWTVHDLGHIHQITRTMSKNYLENVGPWFQYLGVLNPHAK
jgi:hypothetical protein